MVARGEGEADMLAAAGGVELVGRTPDLPIHIPVHQSISTSSDGCSAV